MGSSDMSNSELTDMNTKRYDFTIVYIFQLFKMPVMNTQKVAITIPKNLLAIIDTMSKQQGVSRSKFISSALKEKISKSKEKEIKEAYNAVFSDSSICEEQLETAKWFETAEYGEGQEW